MKTLRTWRLVAYDVRDPARLRRVERLLGGYGQRLQYSVWRCRLGDREVERLRFELGAILDPADDLLIIALCAHCAQRVHATGRAPVSWDAPPTFEII